MTKRTINSKVVNKKVLVPAVIAVVAAVVILTGVRIPLGNVYSSSCFSLELLSITAIFEFLLGKVIPNPSLNDYRKVFNAIIWIFAI